MDLGSAVLQKLVREMGRYGERSVLGKRWVPQGCTGEHPLRLGGGHLSPLT